MARFLTFRYPECGFEVNIRMEPGQTKSELVPRFSKHVSRSHRRSCEQCRARRRERFQEGRRATQLAQFRTRFDNPSPNSSSQ